MSSHRMDLITIKFIHRTKLVCGLLIFAWIALSAVEGGKIHVHFVNFCL